MSIQSLPRKLAALGSLETAKKYSMIVADQKARIAELEADLAALHRSRSGFDDDGELDSEYLDYLRDTARSHPDPTVRQSAGRERKRLERRIPRPAGT
jgi:hypothetical protein